MEESKVLNSLEKFNSRNLLGDWTKACQIFFKKFLWRIIYTINSKELQLISEHEKIIQIILEIKKPKAQEIYVSSNKKFLQVNEGRDIYVITIILKI